MNMIVCLKQVSDIETQTVGINPHYWTQGAGRWKVVNLIKIRQGGLTGD